MIDIQASREHEPLGRVVVLQDTNGDGRMDKRTVFADGLMLARALKVLDNGVLVGEPPNLWFMQDTNHDLKADTKELVTDTYGRLESNVEHNANSLLWALDNWIYTSEVDTFLRLKNGKFETRRRWRADSGARRRTTAGACSATRTSRRCTSTWCRRSTSARNAGADAHARQRRVPRAAPATISTRCGRCVRRAA